MPRSKKSILFIAWNPSQHGYFKALASVFESSEYTLKLVSGEELVSFFYEPPIVYGVNRLKAMQPIGKGIKGLVKKILCNKFVNKLLCSAMYPVGLFSFVIARLWRQYRSLRKFNRKVQSFCAQGGVAAVVTGMPFFTYFAWECMFVPKVPVPVFGILTYSTIPFEFLFERYKKEYNSKDRSGQFGRWLADKLVPNWGWQSEDAIIYPAMPFFLLTALVCGVPRKATLQECRNLFAGGIIPSPRDKKELEHLGPVPESWAVTGDISSDKIVYYKKNYSSVVGCFHKEYGFQHLKTCAIDLQPQLQSQYTALLLRLAQYAKIVGWNVIFCPHPRTAETEWLRYKIAGFAVAKEATLNVLPLVDLYISFESCTCMWAAELGIPVLSLGVFGRFGFSDRPGAKYFASEESAQFEVAVQKVLACKDSYKEMYAQAQKVSSEYGIHDGRCGERVLNYLIGTIEKSGAGEL